jgi:hypothetical protein
VTTARHERDGALEAIDRILNRGGDADDVLRAVLEVLSGLYEYVRLSFEAGDELVLGPAVGTPQAGARSFPVVFRGETVAELEAAWPDPEDEPFLARVATLISPHCLAGWNAGGET